MISLIVILTILPNDANAYKFDTHYWLKLKLAINAGFSINQSRLIAEGDWGMDDNPATVAETSFPGGWLLAIGNALNLVPKENTNKYKYHCLPIDNPDDSNSMIAQKGNKEIKDTLHGLFTRAMNDSNKSEKLVYFGQYLHCLEDKWSHWGYTTSFGHAFATIFGKDPDTIHNKLDNYKWMVYDVMENLFALRNDMESLNLPISPMVHDPDYPDMPYTSPYELNHPISTKEDTQEGKLLVSSLRTWDKLGLVNSNLDASANGTEIRHGISSRWVAVDTQEPKHGIVKQGYWTRGTPGIYYYGDDAVIYNTQQEIRREIGAKTGYSLDDVKMKLNYNKIYFNQSANIVNKDGHQLELPDDPDKAIKIIAEENITPAYHNLFKNKSLSVAYNPEFGNSIVSGSFDLVNTGSTISPATSVLIIADDISRGDHLSGKTIEIPAIMPNQSQSINYNLILHGSSANRPIQVAGMMTPTNQSIGTSEIYVDSNIPSIIEGKNSSVPIFSTANSTGEVINESESAPGYEIIKVQYDKIAGPSSNFSTFLVLHGLKYPSLNNTIQNTGNTSNQRIESVFQVNTSPTDIYFDPLLQLQINGSATNEEDFNYTLDTFLTSDWLTPGIDYLNHQCENNYGLDSYYDSTQYICLPETGDWKNPGEEYENHLCETNYGSGAFYDSSQNICLPPSGLWTSSGNATVTTQSIPIPPV